MKKTITSYILAALIGLCSLASCTKDSEPAGSVIGEWLVELKGAAFDLIESNEELTFPEEANGLAIIYHFHDNGLGWKEMDVMQDGQLVYVPYDRYHTTFRYSVSPDGMVDINFLDEDGEVNEENDELIFDGNSLTDIIGGLALIYKRATEAQIKKYQEEADAWYGGADNSTEHSITGVGEGWTWAGDIAATAVDR